jgi:PPOX class probable F420-dependent enzyme
MTDDALTRLLADTHHGILVTLRPNGRPQLSNVSHTYDPEARLVRVSVTDTRVKVRNVRRDPRASFHVTSRDFWRWAVGDGIAELTPVATDPGDATVEELIEIYRAIAGEHPDWDDFRRAMVADRRLVLRLRVERIYGTA